MLETGQEGGQADKATTRFTTQLEGMTRSTTRVGDATRLMEHIGGQASTLSRDVGNEVTRRGSQISRDPFLLHSEREGSQTGNNTTKAHGQET